MPRPQNKSRSHAKVDGDGKNDDGSSHAVNNGYNVIGMSSLTLSLFFSLYELVRVNVVPLGQQLDGD